MPIANITPALFAKYSRPYATAGGNSIRLCARNIHRRVNGGDGAGPIEARRRSGSWPYIGHATSGSFGATGTVSVGTNSTVDEPCTSRDACFTWR